MESAIFLQIYIEQEVENHEEMQNIKFSAKKPHKFHVLYDKNTKIFLIIKIAATGEKRSSSRSNNINQQLQQRKYKSYIKKVRILKKENDKWLGENL